MLIEQIQSFKSADMLKKKLEALENGLLNL